ncbi:hypothetical protein [Plebeiibacterium marinum]|uniref:Uncharacterized protein n=1 Tax=Plebeiibacterium marinum TaxID=2992111 RepID=A0AAE3SI17_9BACT|nr:hypothetical protein [Plebeiobacterium marinum]MCW3804172.1 hypothetical protein [Plebeiobacterium marinum]
MRAIYIINIRRFFKRLFQTLAIGIPVLGLYFLYQPEIYFNDYVFINPVFPRFKWWQCLVVYFIAINAVGVLLFTGFSLFYTYRRTHHEKILPRLSNAFTNLVVEYLYSEKYQDEKEKEALFKKLRYFSKYKLHVEALFISITRIQETVAVNHSPHFKELLDKVDLYKTIDRFLYSYNLSDRILAMRIISYLRLRDERYEKRIYKYSDSKNYALRTEAYGALIRLMEGENQLADFIGSKYNLSLFDINITVNAVIKNHKMNIDYIDFLSSDLNRKIITGLILAKYRYRKGSRSLILILNFIGHQDYLLNRLAWDSFLKLVPKDEGVDIIVDRFNQEPDDIKFMILKDSHETGSETFHKFLQEVITNSSLMIKIEAMKILFKENFDFILPFVNSEDKEIKMALQEVSDLNINQ